MILSTLPLSATTKDLIQNQIITFDGISVKVAINDINATLFTASYESDGELKAVEMFDFEDAGEYMFTLENKADKAMLWSEDMQPYDCKDANAMIPVQTPTAVPESNEIYFDRTTYPLYVGNRSSNSFDNWDGYGSDFTLNVTVNSEEYSESDIVWNISDDSIASMTVSSDKTNAIIKGRRTGFATVSATLPNNETAYCYISVIDNSTRLTVNRIELNADALNLAAGKSAQLIPIL